MPLVNATITVNFVASFECTRVCWSTSPSGPFNDCVNETTVPGDDYATLIPIQIDTDNPLPTTYYGYIQSCCEESDSTNGRVPWSAVYTPPPTCECKQFTIECTVGNLGLSLIDPGSGYPPGSVIPIVISGGGGVGASYTATIGDYGIKNFSVTNSGSGYAIPDGNYSDGAINYTTSGGGTGARFEVTVSGGSITVINLLNTIPFTSPGSGYAVSDTITIIDILGAIPSVPAQLVINTTNEGEVQYITMLTQGTGYTGLPTVQVPGGGTDAIVEPTVTCFGDAIVFNCAMVPAPINANLNSLNYVCAASTPSLPSGYTVTETDCCDTCILVTFRNIGIRTETIYYTECGSFSIETVTLLPGASTSPLCAITNSWYQVEGSSITAATSGPCTI